MSENKKLWYKVARTIVKAGKMPFPITDSLIEFVKTQITRDQARFILIFRKPSLNIEQIKSKVDMSNEKIETMLNTLMNNGIIGGAPSRSTGIFVYTLKPLYPGMAEYSLMKGNKGEKEKKIAYLLEELFKELREGVQKQYDFINQLKNFPAPARVVPVEEEIEVRDEIVLPAEEISKIIDENDKISVTYCYCRQEKDLINDPCKLTEKRENCLLFGKVAAYSIEYNFAKPISQESAKQILKESEDSGLVHKVFHVHMNPERDIEGICSCCKCCCGLFRLYYEGAAPMHTFTSYLAKVNKDLCIDCGICVEKCPMEAIFLDDSIPIIDENKCIGCGVCSHNCSNDAIKLERTGWREVFVPPPRITI